MPEANEANQRAASVLAAQIDLRLGAIQDAKPPQRPPSTPRVPEAFSEAGLAGGDAEDVLRRLEHARAAYGADHPDVKRLERQYEEVSERSGIS